ncbi:hypothetical protein BDV59DRAFT_200478 [Aspergillus ambiguus]|uniref:uncharacterized protein n=1 Tax=Aspergillus ambiguus TaxID=176160 RepID=UPI003CCD5909
MSEFPQPPDHRTQLAQLSLAKFSHTTTSLNHKGPFNWSHLFSNGDILVIFERLSNSLSTTTRLLLRVTHNHDILEEIDLVQLTRETMAQPLPHQPSQPRPVFAVVVKLPCLAVKYPTAHGWVRRFQIKFSQDSDYYKALSILSDINCPFSEASTGSTHPSRKPPSSQWHPGSISTPREQIASSSSMGGPSTTNVFPTYPHPIPPMDASSVTAGSLPSSSGTTRTTPTDYTAPTYSSQPHTLGSLLHRDPAKPIPNTPSDCVHGNAENRPLTSIPYQDVQSLDQVLPPKRELPFSKPPMKRLRTDFERPSTFNIDSGAYGPETLTDVCQHKRPSTSTSFTTHGPTPYQKVPPPKASKIITLKYPPVSLPATKPGGRPVANIENKSDGNDANDRTVCKEQPLASLASSDLSSYLSAPTKERTVQLENWICSHIRDDGFLQLCQDVEGIWKRIALGS